MEVSREGSRIELLSRSERRSLTNGEVKISKPDPPLRLFVLLFIAVILLVNLWSIAIHDPPGSSVTYDKTLYLPHREMVCPGDFLEYDSTVQVHSVPAVLEVVTTWWDVGSGSTLAVDNLHRRIVYLETGDVPNARRVKVPNLSPGFYEFRVAAYDTFARPAAYRVPFTVAADCPVNFPVADVAHSFFNICAWPPESGGIPDDNVLDDSHQH